MRSAAIKTIAASAGLALSLGTANAALVTSTYAVTGSNFSSTLASPFPSITESFTITFDTSNLVSEQTAGITLNPSTITPTATLAYTYNPFANSLVVGGRAAVATADPTTTDFALIISNASDAANYSIASLSYTYGNGATYTANTVMKASVAEPASLALVATAAGTLAFFRRRRARS